MCVYVGLFAVKMSHLSAATCQDVPSLGRGVIIMWCVYVGLFAVKMSHFSAATCQDVPFWQGELYKLWLSYMLYMYEVFCVCVAHT